MAARNRALFQLPASLADKIGEDFCFSFQFASSCAGVMEEAFHNCASDNFQAASGVCSTFDLQNTSRDGCAGRWMEIRRETRPS